MHDSCLMNKTEVGRSGVMYVRVCVCVCTERVAFQCRIMRGCECLAPVTLAVSGAVRNFTLHCTVTNQH